jgi:hypothetical protein
MMKIFIIIMLSFNVFGSDCYESSIIKPMPFMGNNDEIFQLSDGSMWEVKYSYEYMYAYSPQVIICPSSAKLIVDGKKISVHPLSSGKIKKQPSSKNSNTNVIESNIDGDFEGWDGETIFKLRNGQIWQQSSYAYTYHYAYSPEVTIYKTGGLYKMKVDGVDSSIFVTQLK